MPGGEFSARVIVLWFEGIRAEEFVSLDPLSCFPHYPDGANQA